MVSTAPSFLKLFYDGVRYHIETSSLICSANQWTGFYIITASVMKELNQNSILASLFLSHFSRPVPV